jgi:hypothetical protein
MLLSTVSPINLKKKYDDMLKHLSLYLYSKILVYNLTVKLMYYFVFLDI